MLLLGFAWSLVRDFESYLRFVVCLDEGDIHLFLKQISQIFLYLNYPQAFTQLMIIQRLFTQWEIIKEQCKMNTMILA